MSKTPLVVGLYPDNLEPQHGGQEAGHTQPRPAPELARPQEKVVP